jgi:hypothetical protein
MRTADGTSQALPHTCRCGGGCAGASVAHCGSGCPGTFTSPSSFDAHRIRNTVAGGCRPPASVGMVEHSRVGYTAWGFPSDEANIERLRALGTPNPSTKEHQ